MLDLVVLSIYKQKKHPPPHPHPLFRFFFFLAAVIFYSEGRRYEEQKSKLAPDVAELAEAGALLVCINSVS